MNDDELLGDAEKRPRIKVTDRRKFTADGTPRGGAPADADPAEDAAEGVHAPPPRDPDAPSPATGGEEHAAGIETPPAAASAEDEQRIAAPQASLADLPRDFSAFVESMYLEAMLYLGALPDPRSGQVMEDLELARYKIDLLAMIQAKTQGNLTDDEKKQLEEVLYQLRTVFVQQQGAATS